jgi:PAS domain-containing protein
MSDLTFAIGEVAAMLGLSPHTIRAWERRHLFASPMRSAAGQRRYTTEDVELLRQIKHGRHVLGFSMRVATMAAEGTLVPEAREVGLPGPEAAASPEEPADPLGRVADLVSDIVIVVDASGRMQHANTAFVRFCEVLPGQLQGLRFADFVDPFDRAKAVRTYQTPLRPRRGWEFGLRTKRRRALFAFDCWPAPSESGPVVLLVGRRLDDEPPAVGGFAGVLGTPAGGGFAGPARREAPAPVRALLEGVADPVRTLELMRPWLDATSLGVVLTGTDADLTVLVANEAFRRLASGRPGPVEGRPWRELAPGDDAGRLVAAAREVVGSAQRRSVSGLRPPFDDRSSPPPTIWDVELCPVSEVGGAVTHLLLTIRDVTAEVAATRRLEALASSAAELRQASDARMILAAAARHAGSLLRNAGSLVATARGPGAREMSVVAAEGVWALDNPDGERELRLALIRDVVRTGASIEIERAGAAEAVETVRVVPLLARPTVPERTAVLGALAFSRLDAGPFSAADRLLVDEFAGRIGMALGRADLLSPGGQTGHGLRRDPGSPPAGPSRRWPTPAC